MDRKSFTDTDLSQTDSSVRMSRISRPDCEITKPRFRRLILMSGGVLLGLVVALLLAECVLQITRWRPQFNIVYANQFRFSDNPVLKYELLPGAADDRWRISSAGLRDREFSFDKPGGVYRVAVIGDSVAYGFGYLRAQAFPKVLERWLNQHFAADALQYEVMNFGVTGYNIDQVVEMCRVRVMPFDPDLVIYAYVLNDPHSFSLELRQLKRLAAQAQHGFSVRLSSGFMQTLSRSRVFLLGYQATLALPVLDGPGETDILTITGFDGSYTDYIRTVHRDKESWSRVSRGFSMLSAIGKENRERPLPILVTILPVSMIEEDRAYALADVHSQVVDEARSHGLDVADMAPSFRAARKAWRYSYFRDIFHLEPRGHRVVAMAILKTLAHNHLLPDSAASFDALAWDDAFDEAVAKSMSER